MPTPHEQLTILSKKESYIHKQSTAMLFSAYERMICVSGESRSSYIGSSLNQGVFGANAQHTWEHASNIHVSLYICSHSNCIRKGTRFIIIWNRGP